MTAYDFIEGEKFLCDPILHPFNTWIVKNKGNVLARTFTPRIKVVPVSLKLLFIPFQLLQFVQPVHCNSQETRFK